MTLAVLNGPLNFPVIDAMKSHTGTTEERFVLRRLTDSTFVLVEWRANYPTGRTGYDLHFGEISSGGTVTLGDLQAFPDVGGIVGFTTLTGGRFIVLTSPNYGIGNRDIEARLHAADGTVQDVLKVVDNYDDGGMLFGRDFFYFIGDYFDLVESEPGTVLVVITGQDRDSDEMMMVGFQLAVGVDTLSFVGTPTLMFTFPDPGAGGLDPIGAFVRDDGVVLGATWGGQNMETHAYACQAGVGGMEMLDYVAPLDTDIRLVEPVVARTTGGMVLFGSNDVYGGGHAGTPASWEGGDAVVTVPFAAGAFGTPTRTQFNDSDRFWYVPTIYDAERWPDYQQAVDRIVRAVLTDGWATDFIRYEEFDTASTASQDDRWAPLERLDITLPTASPYSDSFSWEWCYYEGLSTTRGLILAGGYNHVTDSQRTALWAVTRGAESNLGANVGGTRVRWA